jgi:hypothetical protein
MKRGGAARSWDNSGSLFARRARAPSAKVIVRPFLSTTLAYTCQ